jgi:carbon-monoxide dehydrogenase small subunit
MTRIALTVNGEPVEHDVEPRQHLADLLRERLNLTGTHLGCEQGACGACTVMLNGSPVRSCLAFAVTCNAAEIRTIEGFRDDPVMARLRDAFSTEHGLQCGFCTPGMLITAHDIVTRLPSADEARIRLELSGNLCRCTGYVGIVRAVQRVAAEQRANPPIAAPAPVRSAPASFTPIATAAAAPVAAPVQPVGVPAPGAIEPGWTRLTDGFDIDRPPLEVWRLFADVPRMVACLPGAQVDSMDGDRLAGRMAVKLGPITASFIGTATLQRDEAAHRGEIAGAGADGAGASRARGRVVYSVAAAKDGTGAHVDLVLDFTLQGVLAQFGRTGLVKDLVRRLVRQFADSLAASLDGKTGTPPAALHVGALGWSVLWARLKALFRRG